MFYLKQLVSSGNSFPYTVGEPYTTAFESWSHFKGTSKEDGAEVSIFKISSSSASDPKIQAARNSVKRLKSVRRQPGGCFRLWMSCTTSALETQLSLVGNVS